MRPIFACGRSAPRYQKTSHTSSGGALTSSEKACFCIGDREPRTTVASDAGVTASEPRMEIADSILDLVGNTPLVRLGRVGPALQCTLVAKVEMVNPGGSVKDRPAIAMIDAAERDGLLQPGGTIVEPTSGNTGVGLAIVAAQRGYHCIFVMSDKMSDEKVALLRAYGAEVVVCPTAVPPEHRDSLLLDRRPARPRDAGRVPARPVLEPGQPRRARAHDRSRDLAPDRRAGSRTSSPASAPAARSPASAAT